MNDLDADLLPLQYLSRLLEISVYLRDAVLGFCTLFVCLHCILYTYLHIGTLRKSENSTVLLVLG